MKQEIELKEGMTAKVEGGKLVIEMPGKYTPKKGDFVTCDRNTIGNKWIMIWGGVSPSGIFTSEAVAYNERLGLIKVGCSCRIDDNFRPSTPEEIDILLSAMRKQGKRWDAEKMQIVDINKKWKPKAGDVVTNQLDGAIFIQKSSYGSGTSFYAALYNGIFYTEGKVGYNSPRPSTYEERCTFFARLVAEGYKWNAKKLKLTKAEDAKPEYKEGDFLRTKGENVFIYKNTHNGYMFDHAFMFSGGGMTTSDGPSCDVNSISRHATEQEKQKFLDGLAKIGKKWNATKKRIEDIEPTVVEMTMEQVCEKLGMNVKIVKK